MTRVALDQLLQVTAPAPTSRPSSRSSADDGDLFRSHLDRAAEAAAPKEEPTLEESDATKVEDDQTLEVANDDQDDATADNAVNEESTEQESSETASREDEPAEETNSEDEVTISAAAAVIEVEQQVVEELPLEQATTDETEETEGNEQQNQQAAQQTAEGPTLETPTETTDETLVFEGLAKDAQAEQANQEIPTAESEPRAQQQSAEQVVTQSSVITAAASATPEAVKPSTSTTKQDTKPAPTTTVEPQADEGLPTNAENEERQTSRAPAQATPDRPIATASELLDLPEPEVATATNAQVSETTAKPIVTAANNQEIAGVEKAVGNVTASSPNGSTANTSNSSTPDTPTVDRVRFVQRVSGAIRSAQQRDGQIQLRLSPPELGTLKIQLTVNESAITANLETETATARTILLDNLPALRERLAEQGMTIEKFDVDVGREGQQQQTEDRGPGDRDSQRNESESDAKAGGSRREALATTSSTIQTSAATPDSGLDVRI